MKKILVRLAVALGLVFGAIGVGSSPAFAHDQDSIAIQIWTAGYPSGTISRSEGMMAPWNCAGVTVAQHKTLMQNAIAYAWGISTSRILITAYTPTSGTYPNRSGNGTYKLDGGSNLGFYWQSTCHHSGWAG